MFKQKVESMSIREFMNKPATANKRNLSLLYGGAMPLALTPLITKTASAQSPDQLPVAAQPFDREGIYAEVMTAFEPIIDLCQIVAYPIATVVVLIGSIMIMVSGKDKAISMMQNAGIGLILVSLMPMLLDILNNIMRSIVL